MSDMDISCSVDAGLPNIIGILDSPSAVKGLFNIVPTNSSVTGAFSAEYTKKKSFGDASTTANFATKFNLNASLYNPIYGNSESVNPTSLTTGWFIRF